MSTPPINRSPSHSGHVVPSHPGVEGPSQPVAINRTLPPPHPPFVHFHFLTEINGFNGFIFSAKPENARPVPDASSAHPGFPLRKSFQSRIPTARPTFPVLPPSVSHPRYPPTRDAAPLRIFLISSFCQPFPPVQTRDEAHRPTSSRDDLASVSPRLGLSHCKSTPSHFVSLIPVSRRDRAYLLIRLLPRLRWPRPSGRIPYSNRSYLPL